MNTNKYNQQTYSNVYKSVTRLERDACCLINPLKCCSCARTSPLIFEVARVAHMVKESAPGPVVRYITGSRPTLTTRHVLSLVLTLY